MSQEKAQLIAPLGNMTVPGVTATGVITATSFEGNIAGSATSIKQGSSVSAGVVTASSFVGNLTGNIQRLADSGPNISVGVVTATSFSGNLTGSVTDLTSAPAITVGVVTATTLKGPVTGNITGNVSGHAGGLGINYNGGWTGAGTSQISVGVITATSYYGDGSNLDGVSSGPVSQQAVTINSGTTAIDLSNGNLIYASQSANTTVSFANSENGNVYFVRVKDATDTARTITWPDRIKWEGGSAPTLITANDTGEAQVFLLVTRDEGVTWYGKEIYSNAGGKELWTWGSNRYGQLGILKSYFAPDSYWAASSPVQIAGGWKQVCAGEEGSFATKNDGTLWSWGNAQDSGLGVLGLNDFMDRSSPTQIGTDTDWSLVESKDTQSMAIKTDGTLWAWGNQGYGAGGFNDRTQRSSPTQVGTETTWSSFGLGFRQSLAIKTNGTLWGMGNNNYGQRGSNNRTNHSSPTQIGTDTTWNAVTGGANIAVATKTDGTLWTWGENHQGQLGLNQGPGGPSNSRSSPTQIPGTTWNSIGSANYQSYATKTDGTLWAWGVNAYGQFGQNNRANYSSPVQIPGTTWAAIVPTYQGMLASKTDGTLWSWGRNYYGKLGLNQGNDDYALSSPAQIPGTNWNTTQGKQVADGGRGHHICWLRE